MKITALAFVLLALATPACLAQPNAAEREAQGRAALQEAQALEREGKGAEAVQAYRRAARLGNAQAARRLSEIYLPEEPNADPRFHKEPYRGDRGLPFPDRPKSR